MNNKLRIGAAVAAAALLAASAIMAINLADSRDATTQAAVNSPTPTTFLVVGTVTVPASIGSEPGNGGDCYTPDGYGDIREGAQVTVKDAAGTVIALGRLDPGHTVDSNGTFASKCIFGFTLTDVPEGKDFYLVEVSHRGELRYTRGDLASALTLTLGDR